MCENRSEVPLMASCSHRAKKLKTFLRPRRGCFERLWLSPISFARVIYPYESILSQACRAAENGIFGKKARPQTATAAIKLPKFATLLVLFCLHRKVHLLPFGERKNKMERIFL